MILLVPVTIFFVYFIDLTMHGIHTGYIVIDRGSSLTSTSAGMISNQRLIFGILEKRKETDGHGTSKGTLIYTLNIVYSILSRGVSEPAF